MSAVALLAAAQGRHARAARHQSGVHIDDFEEFDKVIRENIGNPAAVFLESVRWRNPSPDFPESIREVNHVNCLSA